MKTALITGASKGIGLEIAKKFAENGYNVIGTYNKTLPKENFDYIKCDLSNANEIKSLAQYVISKYGKIDILVNNAGMSLTGVIQDLTYEKEEELININLKAPYLLSKYVAESMIKEKNGAIINISSIWGNVGASCEVLYSATKGGINSMTKALAKELAPSNIRVNAISPGVIKTDMLNIYNEEELKELKNETPLSRLGSVKDIADAVFFLANSSFITGQILTVDGGFSL